MSKTIPNNAFIADYRKRPPNAAGGFRSQKGEGGGGRRVGVGFARGKMRGGYEAEGG